MWNLPSTRQSRQRAHPLVSLTLLLAVLATIPNVVNAQAGGGLTNINTQVTSNNSNNSNNNNVIIVDGFVDTTTCYQHLVEADQNGNNDGRLQADEYVEFAQLQTPGGLLDEINDYPEMPLVMQATFVTLTCLCRDERFGGNSRDVNCCLGVDAHIAIVGHDNEASSAQEKTRLFATCFLTDQAIVQVLGSDAPTIFPTSAPTPMPTFAPTSLAPTATVVTPTTDAPTSTTPAPTVTPTLAPSPLPTITTESPTAAPVTVDVLPVFTQDATVVYNIAVKNGLVEEVPTSEYEGDLINAMNEVALSVVTKVFRQERMRARRRHLQVVLQIPTFVLTYEKTSK